MVDVFFATTTNSQIEPQLPTKKDPSGWDTSQEQKNIFQKWPSYFFENKVFRPRAPWKLKIDCHMDVPTPPSPPKQSKKCVPKNTHPKTVVHHCCTPWSFKSLGLTTKSKGPTSVACWWRIHGDPRIRIFLPTWFHHTTRKPWKCR